VSRQHSAGSCQKNPSLPVIAFLFSLDVLVVSGPWSC
jgi:hypothetical protein